MDNFLRLDGVFTLRQVGKNTNDAVVGEVRVHELTFTTIQISINESTVLYFAFILT